MLATLAAPAPVAAGGGSFLYASRYACESSGIFRRRECEIAFANAQTELQERTETFVSRGRCEARYRLCEKQQSDESVYRPALLGVEIFAGRDRGVVAPVLGIETPRLFSGRPITRLIEPRPMTEHWTPIMPSCRFRLAGSEHAMRAELVDMADGVDETPVAEPATVTRERESARERSERLRAAPFVE